MRKVAWPTRPEVINSTLVVLVAVIFMGAVIFVFDYCVGEVRALPLRVTTSMTDEFESDDAAAPAPDAVDETDAVTPSADRRRGAPTSADDADADERGESR